MRMHAMDLYIVAAACSAVSCQCKPLQPAGIVPRCVVDAAKQGRVRDRISSGPEKLFILVSAQSIC